MARLSAISFLVLISSFSMGVNSHVHAEAIERAIIPGYERFFHSTPGDTHTPPSAEGGLLLLQELNCVNCHDAPEAWKAHLGQRGIISLQKVGSRLDSQNLLRFISDPHEFKPGTLMPRLPGLQGELLEALVVYLQSLESKSSATPPDKIYPKGNREAGRELFHTIGCVACHAPDSPQNHHPVEVPKGNTVEKPLIPSVPIRLAQHYSTSQLIAFLLAPLEVRHAGRMPDFDLTESQAADIAAYLQQKNTSDLTSSFSPSPADPLKIERGKQVFAEQHCNACHDTGENMINPQIAHHTKPLDQLKSHQGCLAKTSENTSSPQFALNAHQRESLQMALELIKQDPPQLTNKQRSDRFLVQMNCYACHEWEGKGGLEKARAQYFTVYEPSAHSMGEIGMLPPKLNHAGRKLTKAWFEKLLWGENGGVRPYMTARMPRFGKENSQPFIDPFMEACKNPDPITIDTSGLQRHQRAEYGRLLIGVGDKTSLGCVSCHGIKDRKSLGVPVVNLTHTVDRLQPEYFKELLLNPQAVQPGTLMPPLFIGRKNADQEIEQLWIYLKEIEGARLPPGLLLDGDYELKPEKDLRPIIFRTFLEGAGTQAIAVGFPQQLHFAFDTLEVRPAILWKGRFVDAMTTWEERAMTPAKPLGQDLISLGTHVPFAKLKSPQDPWPSSPGNRLGYRFQGYRVNGEGIPTFLYTYQDLNIQETLTPIVNGFRRQIKVQSSAADVTAWHFFGLAKNAKVTPVSFNQGIAELNEQITWPQP